MCPGFVAVRHTLALGHRDALEAVRRLGVATLRLSEAFLLILRTAGHGRRESVRRLSMCGPCVSHLSAFAHVGGAGVLLARRGEGKMKINSRQKRTVPSGWTWTNTGLPLMVKRVIRPLTHVPTKRLFPFITKRLGRSRRGSYHCGIAVTY